MARPSKHSPESRRRAVIEVIERGRPIVDVARDLGIGSPETLRNWVKQARRDAGLEVGPTTEEKAEKKGCVRRWPIKSARSRSSRRPPVFSPRNSTPDIGERGVHRRQPSPLARYNDVRRARTRRAHLLRSEATDTISAHTRRSGCQRRDSTDVGITIGSMARNGCG